ncbi:MAG TPA: MerR family transcriptional regulator [Paludibacter sp.]|nr:MerR family transcriptional regulator [Paludibacter sp.]
MEKIYYSISEVAEILKINQSNLRFWEKEFDNLKPKRNEKGTRFYTEKDLETINQIIFLVKDQKLTLKGAKRKITQKMDVVAKQQRIVERLKKVRQELKGISNELSK